MQFQADLLRINIDRPICKESTAMGVAFLAGLKAGLWTMEELSTIRQTEKIFEPQMAVDNAELKYSKWSKAVCTIRKWSE